LSHGPGFGLSVAFVGKRLEAFGTFLNTALGLFFRRRQHEKNSIELEKAEGIARNSPKLSGDNFL
jgi:hypothetical protein